ncbi:hypothetical protein EON65_15895, partial [archaeon]
MSETSSSSELEAYLLQLDQQAFINKTSSTDEINKIGIVLKIPYTSLYDLLNRIWSYFVYIVILTIEGVQVDCSLILYLLAALHNEIVDVSKQLTTTQTHHLYRLVVVCFCCLNLLPLPLH